MNTTATEIRNHGVPHGVRPDIRLAPGPGQRATRTDSLVPAALVAAAFAAYFAAMLAIYVLTVR